MMQKLKKIKINSDMDTKKSIKKRDGVFSGQNGERYGEHPVMPLLKYNFTSYFRNTDPLPLNRVVDSFTSSSPTPFVSPFIH